MNCCGAGDLAKVVTENPSFLKDLRQKIKQLYKQFYNRLFK
jgi:hypothetical protein